MAMKGRNLILSVVGALFVAGALAQSPRELERRREAVRDVILRADSGDGEALYQLALLHERGYDSIPQDSVAALKLLRSAAEAQYPPAENLLGYILIRGDYGLTPDTAEGLNLIERAAMKGDSRALSNLGYLWLYGEGVEHDDQKGAYWLQRASDAGIISATSMLGDLYRDGRGVEQDSLQASALYRLAFDKGLTDAGYKLFELNRAKTDTLPAAARLREGLYFFRRSMPEAGVQIIRELADSVAIGCHGLTPELRAHAKALMGDAYSRARGVEYNYELSTRYYLDAARAGNPSAEFVIGEMLEIFPDLICDYLEEEVPVDMLTASYWLQRAAAQGVNDASEATRRLHNLD